MPRAQRPVPPYAQIADHYRDAILMGDLQPGLRLPSIAEIADEWGVAKATAAKAITRLQVEGVVYTSPQGTYVSSDDVISRTPGDRIRGPRPRRIASGETVTVNAADLVKAPDYVSGLLGRPPGSEVVRREEVTSLRGHPKMLSVDWIPADSVLLAPDLTSPQPLPDGAEHFIATVTGRHVTHAQDHLRGRAADAREAAALRLPIGSPVLAGVHVWSDPDGVILYGEWVMPPDQVISYTYEVAEEADGDNPPSA
jgi:GntR family transcriptional regulator